MPPSCHIMAMWIGHFGLMKGKSSALAFGAIGGILALT
jgi:hypothetical protein